MAITRLLSAAAGGAMGDISANRDLDGGPAVRPYGFFAEGSNQFILRGLSIDTVQSDCVSIRGCQKCYVESAHLSDSRNNGQTDGASKPSKIAGASCSTRAQSSGSNCPPARARTTSTAETMPPARR